jgi:glutamine amidotransferase
VYLRLHGTTDSEHLFALILQAWIDNSDRSLEAAVSDGLAVMADLARQHQVAASANLIIGDGTRLIATRFAVNTAPPSLYWLRDDPNFPDSAIIASEPLFEGNWHTCPEQSMIGVGENLDIQIDPL